MKKVTKRMVIIAGITFMATCNLLIFKSVKSVGADVFQNWGDIEALARSENWEGKKLKSVTCKCPTGSLNGFSLRCNTDGEFESCTITQQGSNACYKEKAVFGITVGLTKLCEGTGISYEYEHYN